MKKSDLKQLIKPLVKECIHEVLIEEGMLSNIVSEVVQGIQVKPLVESRVATPTPPTRAAEAHKMKETRQKMNSRRQELMESIGKDAYNGVNLFEGTAPLTREENTGQAAGSVDLGSSKDAGVDISSLVGGASHVWNAMK
jgi:hypothetical protein|tara:strand:- start:57 stop:476 length:420 start_codon:yes stop_codon:yes gene_type:complete